MSRPPDPVRPPAPASAASTSPLVRLAGPAAVAAGVVGVVAAAIGTVNVAGNYWFEAFVTPWLAAGLPGYVDTEPSGMLLLGGATSYGSFALGWVLFGVAMLRARVVPAGLGIAVTAAGAAAFLIGQPPMGAPLGLAVGTLGLWMLRHPAPAAPA